jgi:hypothetical protein
VPVVTPQARRLLHWPGRSHIVLKPKVHLLFIGGKMVGDETNLAQEVITSLLENFDCQPVLFVGAGLARRYIDAPDWEGALRVILAALPDPKPSYEYLDQKYATDKILIGSEISNAAFEWAWNAGRNTFPEELFLSKDKSIFLKFMLSEYLKDITPEAITNENPEIVAELSALMAIRPHALITTNYDNMLERVFPGYEGIVGKSVLKYNLNAYGEV